jgi:hypothetical protein
VRNAGLEDLAATNSFAAASPPSSNTTGDVTLFVRKGARVRVTVSHRAAEAQAIQVYVADALYRTVTLAPWASHVFVAPLSGNTIFSAGAASASSTQANYYPASAFDASTASAWRSAAAPTTAAPVYLTYQMASAKSITRYSVAAKTFVGFTPPQNWVLQGSINGTAWTDIHTVSTPGFVGSVLETKTYTVAATTAYLYYRLKFSENSGYKIAVCEFAAYEAEAADANVVFRATNSSVMASIPGLVEMIVEEFSK